VLRFHARHAHVPGGNATIDRRDVTLFEPKEREERDGRAGVRHRDRHMIRIEYHVVTPVIVCADMSLSAAVDHYTTILSLFAARVIPV
jgi:hypothetical protein